MVKMSFFFCLNYACRVIFSLSLKKRKRISELYFVLNVVLNEINTVYLMLRALGVSEDTTAVC